MSQNGTGINAKLVGVVLLATLFSLTLAYAVRSVQLNQERTEEQVRVAEIRKVVRNWAQLGTRDGWFLKEAAFGEADRHLEVLSQIEQDWWRNFLIVWLVIACVPLVVICRKAPASPADC